MLPIWSQRRARQLFPIGRPDLQAAVNVRSSSILRGWYLEVFTASLRQRLGEQVPAPPAAETRPPLPLPYGPLSAAVTRTCRCG